MKIAVIGNGVAGTFMIDALPWENTEVDWWCNSFDFSPYKARWFWKNEISQEWLYQHGHLTNQYRVDISAFYRQHEMPLLRVTNEIRALYAVETGQANDGSLMNSMRDIAYDVEYQTVMMMLAAKCLEWPHLHVRNTADICSIKDEGCIATTYHKFVYDHIVVAIPWHVYAKWAGIDTRQTSRVGTHAYIHAAGNDPIMNAQIMYVIGVPPLRRITHVLQSHNEYLFEFTGDASNAQIQSSIDIFAPQSKLRGMSDIKAHSQPPAITLNNTSFIGRQATQRKYRTEDIITQTKELSAWLSKSH